MSEVTEQTTKPIAAELRAENLTEEMIAGWSNEVREETMLALITASIELRSQIKVETTQDPIMEREELIEQIRLFHSLENIAACLGKIAGEKGRAYNAMSYMYKTAAEELEERLSHNDKLLAAQPKSQMDQFQEPGSVSEEIRAKTHKHGTPAMPESIAA